jgi:spoIIIJ-associated protein
MEAQTLTKKDYQTIEEIVEKLLSTLEIEGTFAVEPGEEMVEIVLDTQETGLVIGYHGEVLEALQLILSLMVAKKLGQFVRISLEVGGYKKNRTEYLQSLATQAKERALAENKEQVLVSLKSWERRLVHMLLKDDEQVTSESSGEGRDRVLIIKPK